MAAVAVLGCGRSCHGLFVGDALYLRFFNDLPGAGQISALGQIGRVEASITSLMRAADVWFWIDLLPGLVLVLSSRELPAPRGKEFPAGRCADLRRGHDARLR